MSPPSLPQLGTILPTTQACPPVSQPVTSQQAARIVSHLAAGSLPQVRVVSAQPGLGSSAAGQQATLVHQTPHQIRMPVSVAAKGISQVQYEREIIHLCSLREVTAAVCATGSGFCPFKKSVWQQSSPGSEHPFCLGSTCNQTAHWISWKPSQPHVSSGAAGCHQLQHQTGCYVSVIFSECFEPSRTSSAE